MTPRSKIGSNCWPSFAPAGSSIPPTLYFCSTAARALLLSAILLVTACSSTYYDEDDQEIRISFGGGGLISSKIETYGGFERSGKKVVIDGQVISADAFLAFGLPNACYTNQAIFSPHSASYLGLVPAPHATRFLAAHLPAKLRKWFLGRASRFDWIGWENVEYGELIQIWPEGACSLDLEDSLTEFRARKRRRDHLSKRRFD